MPLSWLAVVSNFCSNSFLPFLKPYCSRSFFYMLFPRFSWSTLLSFPSCLNFHNLTYLGIDVSTHVMTIPLQTTLNYHVLSLHNETYPITKNIIRHPINQSQPTHPDHTTLHPIQHCLIDNSKFPRFTTVQQNWSNTTLINAPPLLQR